MAEKTPRLFDTHAHLDFAKLSGDLEGVLRRATDAGVERIVTIGASRGLESNRRALKIAQTYEQVGCTAGIHPHEAADCDDEVFSIIADDFARREEVLAIGESGLDYYYDRAPREVQKEVFRRFLQLAIDVEKPIIVHSREAEADTLELIRESGLRRGVIHCFTGSKEMAEEALKLGFHLSFTGIVTFKNGKELLDIAATTPGDRIMVETDAPFLAPIPHRGKTNEPAYVQHTAAAIAMARGESLEAFSERSFENACAFYDRDFVG